jgi:TolB protein
MGAPVDIIVARVDGGGVTNITRGALSATGPTWSADGARLAFSSFASSGASANVHVANADGTGLRKVTDLPGSAYAASAAWSPNGDLIAFVSNRDGNPDVFTVRPDGSAVTNLTRHPATDAAAPVGSPPLAWAPDSSKFAFLSDRDGNLNVYAAHVDGSPPARLTSTATSDFSPRWSRDGRCLLFNTSSPSPAGGIDLMVVAADGRSSPERLITVR